ncbi:MAG: hypothetical protein Q9227_002527 [Pyrenula ochraceoflavens]
MARSGFIFSGILLFSSVQAIYGQVVSSTTSIPTTLRERSGETATVTIGPLSDYIISTSTDNPAVTGRAFSVLPAGYFASDGLEVIMGPELRDDVTEAFNQKCTDNPSNSECSDALEKLLSPEKVKLQQRQVAVLAVLGSYLYAAIRGVVAAVLVAGAANGIAKVLDKGNVRLPASNTEQIQTATDATAAAFVTATDDPNPITVHIDPIHEPGGYISGDGDGSFTIQLPYDLANDVDDIYEKNLADSDCPGPVGEKSQSKDSQSDSPRENTHKLRKRLDIAEAIITCLVFGTVMLVNNVIRGPLANMARIEEHGRVLRRPEAAGALVALADVNNEVAVLQQEVDIPIQQWNVIVTSAFWQTYSWVIQQQHTSTVTRVPKEDQDQSEQGLCPPVDAVVCEDKNCNGQDGSCESSGALASCACHSEDVKCPPDKYMPACINCGGDAGGNLCNGDGGWRGCSCWESSAHQRTTFKSVKDFAKAQKAFQKLPDVPDQANPHCELRRQLDVRGTDGLEVDRGVFMSIMRKIICKDRQGGPEQMQSLFGKQFRVKQSSGQWGDYNGWLFAASWVWKPELGEYTCSPDKNTMAQEGKMGLGCGTASYTIARPDPTTTSTTTTSTTTPPPVTPTGCPAPYPNWQSCDIECWTTWYRQNGCEKFCPDTYAFCGDSILCQCPQQTCVNQNRYACAKPGWQNDD